MKKTINDYLFVNIQLILFVLYLFPIRLFYIHSENILTILGAVIALLGGFVLLLALIQLNTNLSPYPSPKSSAILVKTGLYKFVRHPIYTGIILLFTGYAIYISSGFKGIISILVFVLFYLKSNYEEKRLQNHYAEYAEYRKTTGRFFPKFF